MAAGNAGPLTEGAWGSCLEQDYSKPFPLVLWDHSYLARAAVLNIYLIPLQS